MEKSQFTTKEIIDLELEVLSSLQSATDIWHFTFTYLLSIECSLVYICFPLPPPPPRSPAPANREEVLWIHSALRCSRSSWQLSSSQQERKRLSGAVLNSPSTGRKSGLNEAVSRMGHAVRAHRSSHPLIRQQYFHHPFTGQKRKEKLSQGNRAELHSQ